jgi:hypothetical protein
MRLILGHALKLVLIGLAIAIPNPSASPERWLHLSLEWWPRTRESSRALPSFCSQWRLPRVTSGPSRHAP